LDMQIRCIVLLILLMTQNIRLFSQSIDSFRIYSDVKITIDKPVMRQNKKTIICFYALPNGNTTEQTMGKKMNAGDDWHFDIQHIRAQTEFIRQHMPENNFVVIYLENNYKSWPSWKQKHPDFRIVIPHLVDSLVMTIPGKKREVYLNGHSGGGSFIFGYLSSASPIPSYIKRISFIDSDYGYDSSYYPKLKKWLMENKHANLNVFAYNDSIVIYNGKPLVSPTGGTWYRSHLLLAHHREDFSFRNEQSDSLSIWRSKKNNVQFYFKYNMDGGIYHTQQVELNGFIHSVLAGTKNDSRGYQYYDRRVYNIYIR